MNYKDFYNLLASYNLISPIWEYILSLVENEFEHEEKDNILKLLIIYFSLIDDCNVAMSLDKDTLLNKWNKKLDGNYVLLSEEEGFNKESYDIIRDSSNDLISNYLHLLNEKEIPSLFGKRHIFDIDNNWLYLKKYYQVRLDIKESIKRLFTYKGNYKYSNEFLSHFKKDSSGKSFTLTKGQEDIVKKGLNKNLIITGGPGTGKTSSVLYLLVNLLITDNSYANVYFLAPSGKAADRVKKSVMKSIDGFDDEFRTKYTYAFNKIAEADGSTIHSLLSIERDSSAFRFNKENQFSSNSIFIVDEASMIDINIFSDLLNAIPEGARLFILGDKNQLPSVENGAVFGDLLKEKFILENNCKIELTDLVRFKVNTEINTLANQINNGQEIEYKRNWQDYSQFKVEPTNSDICPVYYYDYQQSVKEREVVEKVANDWSENFYKELQQKATDLDKSNSEKLKELFDLTLQSRILSAENEGYRGVKFINEFIKRKCINKKGSISYGDNYPGQLMIINTNNKLLHLFNGDSGVLVKFKEDETLYFMVEASNSNVKSTSSNDSSIFQIGNYVFYAMHLIKASEIDLAYAITIHKSQGSDYSNILVILPSRKGHPLLTRQLVYTAITRTKGNTYILAHKERLEEAQANYEVRDTNIADE